MEREKLIALLKKLNYKYDIDKYDRIKIYTKRASGLSYTFKTDKEAAQWIEKES